MCATRRCGVNGETALQLGLALLGVVLAALAWLPLLGSFGPGG
jgi:hypothetical protein